jgi:2-(1,2-epoxy-1,2-dihydrophenyl)acetyl-CoA isomerase
MADLLESIEDGVAVLTLNRPEALNALSMDIRTGLLSAMDRYADDSDVRCVVITGAGRAFSSGGDVGRTLNRQPQARLRGGAMSICIACR